MTPFLSLLLLLAYIPQSTKLLTADLQITIQKTDSDRGKILVLVFDGEDGFPDQVEKAFKQIVVEPKNKKAIVRLENIPVGNYAVTVLHDEDDNGKMTNNFAGLPREKYGFSNNPKIYFSPPSFEKSAIAVASANQAIQIDLR